MAVLFETADFTGGLNTEQSPLAIADNEATLFENFIVDTFGIRRRDGFQIEASLTEPIIGAFKFSQNEWILVTTTWVVKKYNENTKTFIDIGSISGSVTPKFTYFDPYVCVATGSLYLVDTSTDTISQPTTLAAVDVLVKDGRVWIAGGDEVWASRIGVPTNWANVGGDDSSAQFVQIGYKDGGSIVGFAKLFNDVIVFKTTGTFRLQGSFPSIAVSFVTRQRTALNNACYVSLAGDVIAYDQQGAYRVSSSFRYGDLVYDNIDLKVKSLLGREFTGSVFYLPSLRAIAFGIRDGFLLYFYQTKTWVIWRTALEVSQLYDDGEELWAFGGVLFKYQGDYDSYSPYITNLDSTEIANDTNYINDTTPITAIYKSKRVTNTYPIVVRRVALVFSKQRPNLTDTILLQVGKATFSITIPPQSPNIWDVRNQEIASFQQAIWQGKVQEAIHKHQVQRVEDFYVYLKTSAPISLNAVTVEGGVRDG